MKELLFICLFWAIIPSLVSAVPVPDLDEHSEEWIVIDKGNPTIYIDKKSIRRSTRIPGKIILRVWGKFVYEEPKPYKSKDLEQTLRQYEWFCNDYIFRVLQEIHDFTDGTSELRDDREIRDWQKLSPDMLENEMYRHICR